MILPAQRNTLGSEKTKHKTIHLSKDSLVTPYFANLTIHFNLTFALSNMTQTLQNVLNIFF